jgi:hypothetical protein
MDILTAAIDSFEAPVDTTIPEEPYKYQRLWNEKDINILVVEFEQHMVRYGTDRFDILDAGILFNKIRRNYPRWRPSATPALMRRKLIWMTIQLHNRRSFDYSFLIHLVNKVSSVTRFSDTFPHYADVRNVQWGRKKKRSFSERSSEHSEEEEEGWERPHKRRVLRSATTKRSTNSSEKIAQIKDGAATDSDQRGVQAQGQTRPIVPPLKLPLLQSHQSSIIDLPFPSEEAVSGENTAVLTELLQNLAYSRYVSVKLASGSYQKSLEWSGNRAVMEGILSIWHDHLTAVDRAMDFITRLPH